MKNDYSTTKVMNNGKEVEAVNLTPTFEGQLAIVHLDVIKRLASMLPSVSFHDIRASILRRIERTPNLEDLIDLMESEMAFHTSVNLINTFEGAPSTADVQQDSGSIEL